MRHNTKVVLCFQTFTAQHNTFGGLANDISCCGTYKLPYHTIGDNLHKNIMTGQANRMYTCTLAAKVHCLIFTCKYWLIDNLIFTCEVLVKFWLIDNLTIILVYVFAVRTGHSTCPFLDFLSTHPPTKDFRRQIF